jgi:hypothetical protein
MIYAIVAIFLLASLLLLLALCRTAKLFGAGEPELVIPKVEASSRSMEQSAQARDKAA